MRDQLIRPTQEELEIASAEFSIDYLGNEERISEFLNCELITKKGAVYVTKTVLFPARFLYLANTGKIAGNDVSYQYYIDNFLGVTLNSLITDTSGGLTLCLKISILLLKNLIKALSRYTSILLTPT